jgi:hypothetical protein
MIAVIKPIMGGKSEALAMPKLNGSANKKTTKPETASLLKFCLNPNQPSAGIDLSLFLFIDLFNSFDWIFAFYLKLMERLPSIVKIQLLPFAKMNKKT